MLAASLASPGTRLTSDVRMGHRLEGPGMVGAQERPSQPEKSGVVAVSEKDFKPPKLIKTVAPVYPKLALRMGTEGIVIVEATTDTEGRVTQTKVLKSVRALDKAACNAIKKWVYEPFIVDGRPRSIVFTVIMKFSASGNSEVSDIEPPKLLRQIDPVYPESAKQAKTEGTVVLGITIGETGLVTEVKVLESVPGLDQAAIDAVRQWQYSSAWIGGRPVIYSTTVRLKFSLGSPSDKK